MLRVPSTRSVVQSQSPAVKTQEQDLKDRYMKGLYQDPPRQRAWFKGPDLLTHAHKSLLENLRGECGSLANTNHYLKGRVQSLTDRLARRETQVATLREDLAARNTALNLVTEELDVANESLRQLDTLLKSSREQMSVVILSERDKRAKRLSVLSQVQGESGKQDEDPSPTL